MGFFSLAPAPGTPVASKTVIHRAASGRLLPTALLKFGIGVDRHPEEVCATGRRVCRLRGKYLASSGKPKAFEGEWIPDRICNLEFDSADTVQVWLDLPGYRAARAMRQEDATSQYRCDCRRWAASRLNSAS